MGNIGHEEIVSKFLDSKSVDFNALGKFVAENGSQIAQASTGDYGIRFGHFNILACFKKAISVDVLGKIGGSGIASEVTGS